MTKAKVTQAARLSVLLVLAFTLPAIAITPSAAESGLASASPRAAHRPEPAAARPTVTVRAASGATVAFMTQNGASVQYRAEVAVEHIKLSRKRKMDEKTYARLVEIIGSLHW